MPVRKRGSSWQVDVRKRGIVFRHNYPTQEQADAMLVQVEDAIQRACLCLTQSVLCHGP